MCTQTDTFLVYKLLQYRLIQGDFIYAFSFSNNLSLYIFAVFIVYKHCHYQLLHGDFTYIHIYTYICSLFKNPQPITYNTSKIFIRPIPRVRIALWIFVIQKFWLHPLTALLRHPVQNNFDFFPFIKKNLLTNTTWNNFWASLNFEKDFWDPLGPLGTPVKYIFFHIWMLGIKTVYGSSEDFFNTGQNSLVLIGLSK